ncbi:MAG: ABC transporter substrate-binding protein [Kofleriaceae bacterium]
MKRALWVVLALVACRASKPIPPAEPPDEPVGQLHGVERVPDLVVGVFASLTGSDAALGQAMVRGVRVAVDERNRAGGVIGRRVNVVIRDDQSELSNAEQRVNELIDAEHAVALVGGSSPAAASAGAWVAERRAVPMIAPTSTSGRLRDIGGMVYGVALTDRSQGVAIAKFLVQRLNAHRIAMIVDSDSPYAKDVAAGVELEVPRLGGQIVAMQTFSERHGPSGALKAVQNVHPEAVFVASEARPGARVTWLGATAGLHVPFVGADAWEADGMIGGRGVLAYLCTQFLAEDPDPATARFVKVYTARFGHRPGSVAALSYDATMILLDAIARAKSVDAVDIAAEISRTTAHAGATGTITFDSLRETRKRAVCARIADHSLAYVTAIEP